MDVLNYVNVDKDKISVDNNKVIISTHPIDIRMEDPLSAKKLEKLLVENRDAIKAYISNNNTGEHYES